ncbi:MAG: hypothetical protein ACJAZO_001752 [Myxococcota bacterium]
MLERTARTELKTCAAIDDHHRCIHPGQNVIAYVLKL